MIEKTMRVTALKNFTVPNFPAFHEQKEYVILETLGKILLERNLVEIAVINVNQLDEENTESQRHNRVPTRTAKR